MPFQKQVQRYPAPGVTGMQAGNNPMAFVLPNPVADEGGVIIGRAAWRSAAGKVKNTGSGAPLGIVMREKVAIIPCEDEATMTYAEGQAVPVVIQGDLLLTSTEAVTAGQVLFAKTADGTLVPGTAGGAVASAVETAWTITTSAAAGEIFHASAWYAKTVEVPAA